MKECYEIRRSNHAAFKYLFKAYQPRLYNFAVRYIENTDIAHDIVQECYLHLWEKRSSLKNVSLASLLFTMVRNGCLNYLKHESIVENYKTEYLAKIDGEERLYYSDFSSNAEYVLLYNELQEQIERVIDKLPSRSQEIFRMSRMQGMKNQEIANELHISSTAVEKHLFKVLKILSEQFKSQYSVELCIAVYVLMQFSEHIK